MPWRHEAHLRQELARMETAESNGDGAGNRLEVLLARELPGPDDLGAARTRIAASTALLPITPEMAWAVPQLLKKIQPVSPGTLSTSGVLRSLIRTPEWDEPFAKAFADSGFLTCDRVLERVRWKYDIGEMKSMARQQDGSAAQVLEHCRVVLTQHRTKQPLDWDAVLGELQTLVAWFPDLRTVRLLEQLYARLGVLHMQSVAVVQQWLDWRAGMADALPDPGVRAPFAVRAGAHAPSFRE
jgi:hypothetical protein